MRTVVGTMTGTSMDGVDAVAVDIQGHGLEMTASFMDIATEELGELSATLRQFTSQLGTSEARHEAGTQLGQITADAISKLHLDTIDLIALHGQTIFHAPPKSMQLIDPQPIVDTFSCDVLTDPRQSDLNHGGQGAPITPLADWVMFRTIASSIAIVNLGGFCNVTVLPAESDPCNVRGFDVCCCNLLLDAIARHRIQQAYDDGGREALRGTVHQVVFTLLLDQLNRQRTSHRSLGTGDDVGASTLQFGKDLSAADLLATATAAIGRCISDAVHDVDQVFLAGGGARNAALQNAIQHDGTTNELGVPIQAREAMAMAILGAMAQDGVSITLSQITGRDETSDLVGWVQASP